MQKYFICFLIFLNVFFVSAENKIDLKKINITGISITGLEKTHQSIVERELFFDIGDSMYVENLIQKIQLSENALLNTSLFLEVNISIKSWIDDKLEIEILLRERWHFLGHPIFRLADRNFNVWWTDFNRSFSRTIYGLSFTHFNMRGRNERLHINAHLGYNRKLEISYLIPGFGKKRTFGSFINTSWQNNREVFTSTENHKQVFHRLPEYAVNYINTDLFLTFRADKFYEFGLGVGYNYNQVTDTITEINKSFLGKEKNLQRYLSTEFYFRADTRDRRIYATEGSMLELRLKQSGLGLISDAFMTEFFSVYSQFLNLGKGFYISTQLRTKFSLPKEQPYLNQNSLGFLKDLVRGYEFYVIDGRHHGVFKFNIKKNILRYNLNDGWIPGFEKLQRLPVHVYLKAFFDAGYVYDDYFYTGDFLINTPLWSAGIGLDIVTAYDFVWRVEYAVNHLGENGLYLHFLTDL